ncbi:hypothetical protein D3C81_1493540 [compost metagenome]
MNFNNIPLCILNHIVTLNEIGMLQTNLVAREQTEILVRWILHEILALDVNFTRERNLAIAHFRIFTVIFSFKQLGLSFWIISNYYFQRINNRHRTRSLQLQILTNEMLQHFQID